MNEAERMIVNAYGLGYGWENVEDRTVDAGWV